MDELESDFSRFPDFEPGEMLLVSWTVADEKYEFITPVIFISITPMYYNVGIYTDRGISCLSALKDKEEKTEKDDEFDWADLDWLISYDGNRMNVRIDRLE